MNLARPEELRVFLDRHGLSPKKGLGQHFLCSERVVRAIVAATGERSVLEIGPGPGILTQALAESQTVLALELDERMRVPLTESAPAAEVVFGDALTTDLRDLLMRLKKPRAVVSNLPYYITGPLLERIAEVSDLWEVAVLMMQREVAKRILAPVGDSERGAVSVRMQAEFEIRRVCEAPAGAFMPPPKVDSIVLAFEPAGERMPIEMVALVRSGFTQPRKTLANNIGAAGYPREIIVEAGLEPSIRPHQLSLSAWRRLYELCD
ncbi:MAG: ribosomal RNA small subunit methyltransferase A [Methanoregulaceae archaeon]|nr:ribosomal RNA small subunit methyltransferase A [Methanoregulaceae archaeon]